MVLLAVVASGSAGLTGCQTYPYSKLENEVYNYVKRFSENVPKRFVASRYEIEDMEHVLYHDNSLVMKENEPLTVSYARGRGRYVGFRYYVGYKDLLTGYLDVAPAKAWWKSKDKSKLKADTFFSFAVRSSRGKATGVLVDKSILLATPEGGVMYAKKAGEDVWKRSDMYNIEHGFELNGAWLACLKQQADRVPEGQVQRYMKLANRFNKTYFFRER
jgi:hypothetical protein